MTWNQKRKRPLWIPWGPGGAVNTFCDFAWTATATCFDIRDIDLVSTYFDRMSSSVVLSCVCAGVSETRIYWVTVYVWNGSRWSWIYTAAPQLERKYWHYSTALSAKCSAVQTARVSLLIQSHTLPLVFSFIKYVKSKDECIFFFKSHSKLVIDQFSQQRICSGFIT